MGIMAPPPGSRLNRAQALGAAGQMGKELLGAWSLGFIGSNGGPPNNLSHGPGPAMVTMLNAPPVC